MLITHADMKEHMGYCNTGAREFFEAHGLDWNEFVFHGLPEELLLATGDAMAIEMVERTRAAWAERTAHKP